MFHFTHTNNLESIIQDGLRVGRKIATDIGVSWTLDFFEQNPIYLTTQDSKFIQAFREDVWSDYAILEVSTHNLPLVADLPCLADLGARFVDGMFNINGNAELSPLSRFADEYGFLEIENLLNPETDVARAAISITRTAACLSNISPDRLTLFHQPSSTPKL